MQQQRRYAPNTKTNVSTSMNKKCLEKLQLYFTISLIKNAIIYSDVYYQRVYAFSREEQLITMK